MSDLDRLCEAFNKVLIAGNHIACCIPADHLPYSAHSDEALEKYGAGREYDTWVGWAGIMRQRDAVGDIINAWHERRGDDERLNYCPPQEQASGDTDRG